MKDRIRITDSCYAEVAEYKEQIISDYMNNPFIEALPPLLSNDEVIERLAYYPPYSESERQLDSAHRLHLINRIFQVYQPLPLTLDLQSKIGRTIRQGYLNRNPFGIELPQGYREDYKHLCNRNFEYSIGANTNPSSFTLIGISGLGKTSTLNHILKMYPQVIVHNEYLKMPLSTYQVVFMKLECPYDGSIKGLLYDFFLSTDKLLNTNYYEKMIKTRPTIDMMLTVMNQVVRNINLGVLIIDEIQHLSTVKSGGSQKMLNFFVNLVNRVGLPVIMVGTPKAMEVLQGEFRQARRGVGTTGDMIYDRIKNDNVWRLLIQSIWHYQWTKNEVLLTDDIVNTFYDETQGITDLVIKLYASVQTYSISNGKEDITPSIIKKVAKENLKLVQPMIKALRSGSIREIAKYQDIYMPNIEYNNLLFNTKENVRLNFDIEEILHNIDEKKVSNIEVSSSKVITQNNSSKKLKKDLEYTNTSDIRYIIKQETNSNKSAYEILKEMEYIKSFESDIFCGGSI